jgi:hypothetical protein
VKARLVEAMQRVIVARDQWQKKKQPANGSVNGGDPIKKFDGTSNTGISGSN